MMYKIFLSLGLFIFMLSCSTKRDTFVNRNYHRTISEFNTMFNGREGLKKELEKSENSSNSEIDFTSLLKLEKKIDTSKAKEQTNRAPLFSGKSPTSEQNEEDESQGPFETEAKKAVKAIERHSMEIKGRERNKKIDNAYMLLGKSRYYQGKPFQALEAFNYIITYLDDHDQITNAKIWAARSIRLAGNTFSSIYALKNLLNNKNKLKDPQLTEIYQLLADIYIEKKQYSKAIEELNFANKYEKKKPNLIRNNYLIAQLQKLNGQPLESSRNFDKVIKSNPPIDYKVFATLGIASNFVKEKHNKEFFLKELEKLVNKKKYYFYRGEILYQMGSVAFKSGDIDLAENYFERAIKSKVKYEKTKALVYAKLGDLKFKKRDFLLASNYYDSAVAILPESFEPKKSFEIKKEKLKKFVKLYKEKTETDSILRLSSLSVEERTAIFNEHIKALREKEKEDQKKTFQSIQDVDKRASGLFENKLGKKNKWYFYTNYAKSRGHERFKKRWGNRGLKDNWRWDKSNFRNIKPNARGSNASKDEKNNSERFNVDFYLKQIPNDQEAISILKNKRDESSLQLGKIYYDVFKDNEKATAEFEELIVKNPNKKVKAEANYYLYKLNEDSNPEKAEYFKKQALQNEVVFEVHEDNILNLTPSMADAINFYQQTYDMYKKEEYSLVQKNTAQALELYGKQKIAPKFELLSAMSLARQKNLKVYISALEKLITKYLGYPEAKKARQLIQSAQGIINKKE